MLLPACTTLLRKILSFRLLFRKETLVICPPALPVFQSCNLGAFSGLLILVFEQLHSIFFLLKVAKCYYIIKISYFIYFGKSIFISFKRLLFQHFSTIFLLFPNKKRYHLLIVSTLIERHYSLRHKKRKGRILQLMLAYTSLSYILHIWNFFTQHPVLS